MTTGYEVFGPSVFKTNTGTAGARETLGVCEDSFDLPLNEVLQPVRSSAAGEMPADLQRMGEDMDLAVNLSVFDETVLNKLRYRGSGGTTAGVSKPPGRLVGTNSEHFRLIIAGAYGTPWRFYFTTLRGAQRLRGGTKYSVWSLRFYAWNFVAGTAATGAGQTWWDRTDADG